MGDTKEGKNIFLRDIGPEGEKPFDCNDFLSLRVRLPL